MKFVKNSKGYTLVEVLVAVVILATGLVLVIEGMGRSQHAMRVAENLILSTQLAEEQIAESEIEARQFVQLSSSSDSGREKLPGKTFKWNKRVEPYYHATIEDQKALNQVSANVTWNEGVNRDMDWSLQMLLKNREQKKVIE